jgi:bifunctional non-homologous end joining protein LigD
MQKHILAVVAFWKHKVAATAKIWSHSQGLIGKRAGSRYEAGKRSGAWIKVKLHQEQEFVIGGYTEPEGSRKHFGALLVGFYEGKKFKFAGRFGTGFSEKLLKTLFTEANKFGVDRCPRRQDKGLPFEGAG